MDKEWESILTKKGNIYKGIYIDTDGSIGMCAERNALSTMLTYGESEITKLQDDIISFFMENMPNGYGHLIVKAESADVIKVRSYNL